MATIINNTDVILTSEAENAIQKECGQFPGLRVALKSNTDQGQIWDVYAVPVMEYNTSESEYLLSVDSEGNTF